MTDSIPAKIIIVGSGHAGGNAAALLRQGGYTGEVVLLGDEMYAPYHRPPLSKAYLKGEVDIEGLKLRPDEFYKEQNIELRLGVRVQAIDREVRVVTLTDGTRLAYDALILATGSRARKLPIPGGDLAGIYEMRNVADANKLKTVLCQGKRLCAIGGGYIGLEAAAVARESGAEVVVLDREARVLSRVASALLSSFMQAYHAARGVEFILDANVRAFIGDAAGQVKSVQMADGRLISCDVALVGVGAVANDELARECGLPCENGVVVDAASRTADPAIYAIGDVAWRPLPLSDHRMMRLESVPNAMEQAKQAVASLLGRPAPPPEVPWFWSDQYDLKLQIAGIPFDTDETLLRGRTEDAKFALFHLKGDRIVAVEAVNAPAEFMAGKQLILQRKPISRDKLADTSIPMKQVAI
ncbi:MAG: NAD(P)/FAD-dependent oxidoreductase [Steroidobacteraceae bacterium]